MFNKSDLSRDRCMLTGGFASLGYDWWWHSFTGRNESTGEEKAFFIEFFVCNPASGGDEPVFGQIQDNQEKGVRPSYLMVKAGVWGEGASQMHRFFGWNSVKMEMGVPFSISASDCYLDEKKLAGSISVSASEASDHPEYMCDAGDISWDLKIEKKTAYNVGYGAGRLFRYLQLFEMFWHAEGMKTYFDGEVVYNGVTYKVSRENCFGYSDKNWGRDFTSPWVWLSSNDLVSKVTGMRLNDSVFDIGGGCPKIGPVSLKRKLLSAYWHEGKGYEFNFSKFWTMTRTRFDCGETEDEIIWHVEQKTLFNRMVTDIRCKKKDMLFINYEAPNGKKLHNRLWNGGNGEGTVKLYHLGKLVDEVSCGHVGCEYGVYGE